MLRDEDDTALYTRVLKISRPKLEPGDIFAIGLIDGRYAWGRVIVAGAQMPAAPMPNANLIYVYRQVSREMTPDLSQLTPKNFLIPPTWTNRLGWTRGYWQTVGRRPLGKADLVKHCFKTSNRHYPYLDERGKKLMFRREPCGEWGLYGYLYYDQVLGEALGLAEPASG